MDRLAYLESMLAKQSGDPFVLYALAIEYDKAQRQDDCLTMFERVMSEHPNYLPSYLMAGNALAKAGQLDRAQTVLKAGQEVAQSQGDEHTLQELQGALAEIA